MCKECGCAIPPDGGAEIASGADGALNLFHHLLAENDRIAAHNRDHFARHRVVVLNLMSSPGSGKTALLEATIAALAGRLRLAVIEGDLATENDAERIRRCGVEAVQITTGSACHLDARMVHDALHRLDLSDIDILFIENVGNLVCPAGFDLGQQANVVLLSVTEGDDKPAKYPVIFRAADLVLLSKCDLLPLLDDFDPRRVEVALRRLGSEAPLLELSARRGLGIDGWIDWLEGERARMHARHPFQPATTLLTRPLAEPFVSNE